MDLLPSTEQGETIAAVASYMGDKLPVSRFHKIGYDTIERPGAALKEVAALGWLGFALDESQGGAGGTLADELLISREVGRQLGPLWITGGMLGARIAALAGRSEIAAKIVAGEAAVGFATAAQGSSARSDAPGGDVRLVAAEGAAYAVLVDTAGAALIDVGRLVAHPRPALERQLSLANAVLTADAVAGFVPAAKAPIFQRAAVLLSALQCGNAEATRDLSVEYAKLREQFGRPIGSFQAISHMVVDMALRCEQAWTQSSLAALSLQEEQADALFHVSAAAVLANRAAIENARANIQVHGGIAMTQAHAANYFLKRSHIIETLLGGSYLHLEAVIAAPIAGASAFTGASLAGTSAGAGAR